MFYLDAPIPLFGSYHENIPNINIKPINIQSKNQKDPAGLSDLTFCSKIGGRYGLLSFLNPRPL
jgi:hypothetical protein